MRKLAFWAFVAWCCLSGTGLKAGVIYVDLTSTGLNDGTSWANAFVDLQTAIDAAAFGDQIWVSRGIYHPTIAFDADGSGVAQDRERTFYLNKDGIELYGGFSGSETSLSDRNPVFKTILDGDLGTISDPIDNAYTILYIDGTTANGNITSATLIDGFTFQNGNADTFFSFPNNVAGAIFINGNGNNNSPDNAANPRIANCNFFDNTSDRGGAAIYNYGLRAQCNPSIINCLFAGNAVTGADGQGGAIFNEGGSNGESNPLISNCTFYNNAAINGGGAIHSSGLFGTSNPTIVNSLFRENKVGSTPNRNVAGADIENNNATPMVTYCLTQENSFYSSGTGILNNLDPLFEDAANWDFSLTCSSPLLNAGTGVSYTTDLNGHPHLNLPDIGALEFQFFPIPGSIIYVDQNVSGGEQTGVDWANAFDHLQDALDHVAICSGPMEIWVAQGTYLPLKNKNGAAVTGRGATFYLNKDGIKLYGGFSGDGTETQRSERDFATNPTILSGNVGDPATGNDNAYHVVYVDATTSRGAITNNTVLDGFVIEMGNGNGSGSNAYGGGIYNDGEESTSECSPTIANCTFRNNSARFGGAMCNNSRFGGRNRSTISNCTFAENSADFRAGAVMNDASETGESTATFINCIFDNNSADAGGAVVNDAEDGLCRPTFINGIFSNNVSDFGGAMANYGGSGSSGSNCRPGINNCSFFRNSADVGGAVYNFTCRATFRNSIFWDNLKANSADVSGADLEDIGGSPSVTYCLTQANSIYAAGNNIVNGRDPLFVDAVNGDFRVLTCSPVINVGNNASIDGTDTDLLGQPRIVDNTVDFGALEFQGIPYVGSGVVYVNQNVNGGDGSGSDWANATDNLQEALDIAQLCPDVAEIWVAQGSYSPTQDRTGATTFGREATFLIYQDGIRIYGGFAGEETDLAERDIEQNPTILEGNLGIGNDNSDNAYHIVFLDGNSSPITSNTIIDGFRLQNGNALGVQEDGGGAAIYLQGKEGRCSPTLANCVFTENNARVGGALFLNGEGGEASPTITNCLFEENTADAPGFGGAITFIGTFGKCDPVLTSCIFRNNDVAADGEALYFQSEEGSLGARFLNCVFDRNGGNHILYNSRLNTMLPEFINCTFRGATDAVFYFFGFEDNPMHISNSILWDNNLITSSANGPSPGTLNIQYSLVGNDANNDYSGNNNINTDPLFLNSSNGNFRLASCSPAIGAGDNASIAGVINDLDGQPRIVNNTVDLGAFEFQGLTYSGSGIVYVDQNVNGGNGSGSDWENALTDLQAALDIAQNCADANEIWVAQGVYYPTRNLSGALTSERGATFFIHRDGMQIYGGFEGGETDLSERNIEQNTTVLSGDVGILNDDSDNAYSVVYIDGANHAITANTVLDGFSVEAGRADFAGGAIRLNAGDGGNASPTISQCAFKNNTSEALAGAIFLEGWFGESSPQIRHCTFQNNGAPNGGGGAIYVANLSPASNPIIDNCVFQNNGAGEGSCIFIFTFADAGLVISNSIFSDNLSQQGAIHISRNDGEPSINLVNCVFDRNGEQHVFFTNSGSSPPQFPTFTNCTFAGATEMAVELAPSGLGSTGLAFSNCILWDNHLVTNRPANLDITHSLVGDDIGNNFVGTGNNFVADPLFLNPANGDYRLFACSPALDAGNDAALNGISTDLPGNPRITNDAVDLGAYEYQNSPFANCASYSVRAFLQGPLQGNLMQDQLRLNNQLPLLSPYVEDNNFTLVNDYGDLVLNQEILDAFDEDGEAKVDWVFLELRSELDPTVVLATRSALLQRNGWIVDLDGASPVRFDLEAGSYFLAIKHRNHLGLMSSEPVLPNED